MDPEFVDGKDGGVLRQNCAKLNEVLIRTEQHQPPQPQLQSHHKKQVRRRYHATRSYQGRVLNMAEARREIVAALKIHRASMKATEQQKKQQQLPLQQEVSSPSALTEESHKEIKSRRSTRIYPPNTTTDTLSSFEGNSCRSISYPPHFPWASYSTREVGKLSGDLNITSPNQQPLGLHLNLHNFSNIGVTSNNNGINSSFFFSSSSPSLSPSSTSSSSLTSSYASAVVSSPKISSCIIEQIGSCETSKEHVVQTLHPVMDDERMAEIRLIGEQHDMEWNDKLNMATLAWWCKFLKSSEMGSFGLEENIAGGKEDSHDFLNEVMEVPSWICNQQQFDNYNPDIGYSQQAAALQCLDTGDTKEMDGGWLS